MRKQKIIAHAMFLVLITLMLAGCSELPTPQPTIIPPTPTPLTPDYYQDTGFPIGKFEVVNGILIVNFYADGSGYWTTVNRSYKVDIVYGINGKLFSEMTFKWSSGLQVPVTYLWEFDGTRLHFTPFGLDLRDHRKYVYSKT